MIGVSGIRARVARHAMEGRALASELRSLVAAEELRSEALSTRYFALRAADQDDEADAVGDESAELEDALDVLRALRDTVDATAADLTDGARELLALADEGQG